MSQSALAAEGGEYVGRGRGDFNWEMLDLWLGAYAGGYSGPVDDNPGSNPNKSKSKVPINLLWMEAQNDPAVKETAKLLEEIVVKRMPKEKPNTYKVIEHLYLREHANPSEAESWRMSRTNQNKLLTKMLHHAKRWILDQVEKADPGFILVVPDPIDPRGFVQSSRYKQQVAQRVYYQSVDRLGQREAIKRAADASGYSRRHIRNIIPKDERNAS